MVFAMDFDALLATQIAMLFLGVPLTFGTAIFVAAEFSFVALDPASVATRVAAGDRRAAVVSRALEHLSTQLSGAQVGITLTTILLGYTTQTALTALLTGLFDSLGVAFALSTAISVVLALVLVNLYSMIFGELIPKNLALADPLKVGGWVVRAQTAFTLLFRPLISFLNHSANMILRLFGVHPVEQLSSARTGAELSALVRHSAAAGTLDESTAKLFVRSIAANELTAVDVMTNRGKMEAIGADATAADVVELTRSTGHSRFPVLGEDSDDVIGLVHVRKAIAVPFVKRPEVSVQSGSLMTQAPRVPETMPLAPLLIELRDEGLQMAVVVDEYGGTAGIVTLEDVVEEIVGDVADEHDSRAARSRTVSSDSWLVPGELRPDEVQEQTGAALPDDGPYETVAGLVLSELGRMPEVGDAVSVSGYRLQVDGIEGRRISRVRISQEDPE
ncbi:MAG: hemolysin family protein [Varibaculum sp.]|nr:hemolysin family protein [Varibaculum sp.]